VVHRLAEVLNVEGHAAEVLATRGTGAATELARKMVNTVDAIFACGGDGTVHEVVQGLVCETREPAAALGIVPLGSANAFARHLGLSLDPAIAVLQQARGQACLLPVGKVRHSGGIRYFAVMAGAGPDGALVQSLSSTHKSLMGRSAYYLHAARLLLTYQFDPFEVEWSTAPAGTLSRRKTVSVMAARIGNLGGLFSGLTSRHASIYDSTLKLHILSAPAWLSLPLWFVTGWLYLARLNPFSHCVEASWFACRSLGRGACHAQVDGEWLGELPFEASVVPNALRILLPAK